MQCFSRRFIFREMKGCRDGKLVKMIASSYLTQAPLSKDRHGNTMCNHDCVKMNIRIAIHFLIEVQSSQIIIIQTVYDLNSVRPYNEYLIECSIYCRKNN